MNSSILKLLLVFSIMTLTASGASDPSGVWLAQQKIGDGVTLELPPGVHHVRAEGLASRFLHITNNDDGEKRILFDLSGRKNVTIDGKGAELIMHGHVIPFFMEGAENITIRNLVIDWANPFYAQGEITAAGKGWFECRFEKDYTVEVQDGNLLAINPDLDEPTHFHNLNYIDPVREEQALDSADEYFALRTGNYLADVRADGTIRISSKHFRFQPKSGQVAVFQYAGRTSPAIAVQNSRGIRIEDVTQYHAAGIANVFEGSRDISINRMAVTRRGNRWYSALNDATHFMDCSGEIRIENSLFEFQGDDATNIHGTFRAIEGFLPDNGILLRLMHPQHLGIDTLKAGDTIAFLTKDELQTIHTATVKRVKPIDQERMEIYCGSPLPELDPADHVLMNYITDVDVLIRGNRIQKNRARGLLIKTLGKVRIEDNKFHTPGPALLISAGLTHWFESGPVNDVAIVNNVFDRCNFGNWGTALIQITAHLENEASEKPVMENIRILNNRILQIKQPLLMARSVQNLQFLDNEILLGSGYPTQLKAGGQYQLGPGIMDARLQADSLPEPTASSTRLPAIFGDGMVLQRNTTASIWGWYVPGTRVELIPSWGAGISAVADQTGYWIAGPARVFPRPPSAPMTGKRKD